MSLQEKEILKVVPLLQESTQDFILRSKDSERGAIPSVTVRFGANLEQSLNGCPSKICFNSDRKCYTPAFLEQANKAASEANDAHLRQIFERKIVESSNSHLKILQPKPSTDYCSICKESFPDYLKHITHPVHKKKIAVSKTEGYIDDLCGLVNRPVRRLALVSEEEESMTMSTRKRIKMENSVPVSTSNIIQTSTI